MIITYHLSRINYHNYNEISRCPMNFLIISYPHKSQLWILRYRFPKVIPPTMYIFSPAIKLRIISSIRVAMCRCLSRRGLLRNDKQCFSDSGPSIKCLMAREGHQIDWRLRGKRRREIARAQVATTLVRT